MIAKDKYGYFDAKNKEYVITRPDTPKPWFNYLMNDRYVALISNTAGGVSYDYDCEIYRLLRYRYQNVPYDRPGRYIYIKDHDTGKYWSSTWAPVHTPLNKCTYSCQVGLGYNIMNFETEGIKTSVKYFVPRKGSLEIWDLKITNTSNKTRNLSTFSYAEFAFWGAMRDLMNIDNCPNISRQHHEDGAILHYSYNDIGSGLHGMNFVQNFGFHTSSETPAGYNGDRDKFIGKYRDEKNPIVLEKGSSTNYCEWGGYPIGSLEHKFKLKPGQSKRIVYRTGVSKNKSTIKKDLKQYAKLNEIDAAFKELKQYWNDRISRFQIKTPDPEFDVLANSFIQYQSFITMKLSRSISPFSWGVGRALGFRDSCQDQMGLVHAFPELAKQVVLWLAQAISEKGGASHAFNPRRNTWEGKDTIGLFYDDHNWFALTVESYIKETNDLKILKQKVPFQNYKKTGSVFDRLILAQNNAWKLRGKNGLMQIGSADWNDSLNPGDRETESCFTSALYCASTLKLIEIAKLIGETKKISEWEKRYQTIKKIMNNKGWDGGWYKRMIKKNGETLGSKSTKTYGTIFLEPQPWAIMANLPDKDQAIKLLDNVEKELGTLDGHRIMNKPFKIFDMDAIGSAGIYPEGVKENGSVFNHASSWMIPAECLVGRGDKAMEYFKRMCGTTKNHMADIYESEPYTICQFVTQEPFNKPRQGKNSWLTGTAGWIAQGVCKYIMGIQADGNGLIIDPCVPAEWDKFEIKRTFRDNQYIIQVKNPNNVSKGVTKITVDGKEIKGNRITYKKSSKPIKVSVTLG
ncbi:MAG: hypothetical protein COA79_04080 [Planctomycetota bacterium]|nr:MAG: hypothetical protein COA79_04080 [Planctomycetota bacterium]